MLIDLGVKKWANSLMGLGLVYLEYDLTLSLIYNLHM